MFLVQTSITGTTPYSSLNNVACIFGRETPKSEDVMLTSSGRPGVVYNGVADWVYEEEVLIGHLKIEKKKFINH